MGSDDYHPTPVSEEIVRLAPNARLICEWKTQDLISTTIEHVRQFLKANTPA
jgi:hypothetical protein